MAGLSETTESIFYENKSLTRTNLSATLNRKQDTKTSFALLDEPESSTIYIYQISGLISKIIIYYKYIKNWALIRKKTTFACRISK